MKRESSNPKTAGLSEVALAPSAFKGTSLAFFDQVLLSSSNLLLGFIFIRYAPKTEYYTYIQIMGYATLGLSIQAALINTTALTLLPRKEGSARRDQANVFFGLQVAISLILALTFTIGIGLVPSSLAMKTTSWELPTALGCLVIGTWLREFLRNIQFIRLRPDLSFFQDILYTSCLALVIGFLLFSESFTAASTVMTLAISGLLTALPWLRSAQLRPTASIEAWGSLYREIWPLAKWSLPAALVAWGYGNGYLLIGANVLGPEATAEIAAAKLFATPLGTVFASWANVFRPRISHDLAERNISSVEKLASASLGGVLIVVSIYTGALLLVYPFLESKALGTSYTGLVIDIPWWGAFFLASGISSICNGVLLAAGKYKLSFYAAAMGFVLSAPLMVLLASLQGKSGLMLGIVAGEATYAIVLFIGMRRLLKQVNGPPK